MEWWTGNGSLILGEEPEPVMKHRKLRVQTIQVWIKVFANAKITAKSR